MSDMTRDDIIRMARQAYGDWYPNAVPPELERFAALVAAEKDREILALKEERRKDMAEICSLRESEESLREKNEQFAALTGECAAEQAPDALRKVVADRDALQTENERLRKTAMLTLCTLSCKYEIKHAVKAEREACAKVCDEIERGPAMMIEERHTANECARKIRARGET